MNNINLDRFSRPLDSERVGGYWMQQAHEEQQELNKKHMIDSFIGRHFSIHGLVPDVEEIQEHFYKIDLDADLIEERLELF